MGRFSRFLTVATVIVDARRVARRGPEAIESRQKERLKKLVAHARKNSRLYGELYRDLPETIDDVRALPIVTKSQLMARFDDWVTDPELTREKVEAFAADPKRVGERLLGHYTLWATSGSTGTQAFLVQDKHAIAVMTGLQIARAVWVRGSELKALLRRGLRGAIVFATGGHFMSLTMAQRALRATALLKLGEIISVLSPVREIVARLNALDPTLVASYSSGLALLAEEKASGRLKINPVLILSTGESMPAERRQRIESVFQAHVRETYGASEIQIAAVECRHGRLHLNADWLILEPVNEDFEPVPPGTPAATVLATSLSNYVQPIIRYDLHDRITVLPDRCPCGSALPSIRVEGRTDDILTFRAPGGEDVHILPTTLMAVVAEIPGLHRFQLIRRGPERLVARIEAEPTHEADEVWATLKADVGKLFAANGIGNVSIERSPEAPTPITKAGKLRTVWSEPA